eukprot:scaffold13581_cov101-Skeletonema_marinoi.AAC.1
MMTTRHKPPQSNPAAAAAVSDANMSSSSRLLSRLLSLSSRHSNNDSQLKNDGNDDCIEDEEEEAVLFDDINDDVKQFGSSCGKTRGRNDDATVLNENDDNYSSNAATAVGTFTMKRLGSNNNKFYDQRAESFSSTADMEPQSIYDVCDTIDDSMIGLYTDVPAELSDNNDIKVPPITITTSRQSSFPQTNIQYEYDWILDGDPPQLPIKETDTAASRRRRLFGDDKLDLMLGMLEIENQEFVSFDEESLDDGSVMDNDGCNNDKVGEEVGVGNFADFSKVELRKSLDNEEEEFGSFTAAAPREQHQDFIQTCESGLPYEPPESIGCLVNDITAQLDTTIEECLDISTDNNSVGTNNISDCQDDPSASEHLLKQMNQSETILKGEQNNRHAMQQQSALMSAVLLKSLPVPMATETFGEGDDALIASLTRRIQKQHQAS